MYKLFLHIPRWVQRLLPQYTFTGDRTRKVVYLTFDDGPHPEVTPWVLKTLAQHHAQATFFCIGKNVAAHPAIYKMIMDAGHSIGNHTNNHLNAWKTDRAVYRKDIQSARTLIASSLFRPPYGKLKWGQWKEIRDAWKDEKLQIVLWDVLSGDFDRATDGKTVAKNVLRYVRPGSIVVFHDSEKAFPNLAHALPLVLEELSAKGYRFEAL